MKTKEPYIGEPMKSLKEAKTPYEALIEASKNFKKPSFNKKVKYQGRDFAYADLAEIYNCVKSPLLAEGIIIKHEIACVEDKTFLATYLQYKDGSKIVESIFPLSLLNQTMQQVGAQLTYVKRYALAGMLSLAAEDDDDAASLKEEKLHKPDLKKMADHAEKLMIELPVDRLLSIETRMESKFKTKEISKLDLESLKTLTLFLEAEKRKLLAQPKGE